MIKRAQGLPLNTIIIAIIVIVVLVVIILIFTGQIGGTNRVATQGTACLQLGGYCANVNDASGAALANPCVLGGSMSSQPVHGGNAATNPRACALGTVCCVR